MIAEVHRDINTEGGPFQIEASPIAILTESKEFEDPRKPLIIFGHTYQPPRNFTLVSKPEDENRADVASWVNDMIREQCYAPLFESEFTPTISVHSFYGVLREWYKGTHPDGFDKVRETMRRIPEREFRVLADPYLHLIHPLLSRENQDMLVKIGKRAFEEDFGFTPKGFWLPEAAVSSESLEVLFENGYEFVVLRDNQIETHDQNPMFVPMNDSGGNLTGRIAVFHVDSGQSGDYSFKPEITANGDQFLAERKHMASISVASDTEMYGHHMPFKDQFLKYISQDRVLKRYGFKPIDIYDKLSNGPYMYTQVKENSSWSCEHELGRWMGTCDCGTEGLSDYDRSIVVGRINLLYSTIKQYGQDLDQRLDALNHNWRNFFIEYFLSTRQEMFVKGSLKEAIEKFTSGENGVILRNPQIENLFRAQLARFTAETSCFGFFRDSNERPERLIADANIREIEKLLPDIDGHETILYQHVAD